MVNVSIGQMNTFSCNCQYGTRDSRCCINRARRAELEEAHRLGREGKPLPGDDYWDLVDGADLLDDFYKTWVTNDREGLRPSAVR